MPMSEEERRASKAAASRRYYEKKKAEAAGRRGISSAARQVISLAEAPVERPRKEVSAATKASKAAASRRYYEKKRAPKSVPPAAAAPPIDYDARNKERSASAVEQLRKATAHMKPGVRKDAEYDAYVEAQQKSRMAQADIRRLIAEKAKNPLNQMARFMSAAHVDYLDDEIPTDSYAVFHTKKMEKKAAEAAREAAKPDRYKRLLAAVVKRVDELRQRVAKEEASPEKHYYDPFPVPEKATVKELQNLMKEHNMKGFSGKSAAALMEMLREENEKRRAAKVSRHKGLAKEADRSTQLLKFLVEAHDMSKDELQRRYDAVENARRKQQERITEGTRQLKSDMRAKKYTVAEANQIVAEMNAMTQEFEKENRAVHAILRDALKFKETGVSSVLEEAYGSVIPFGYI